MKAHQCIRALKGRHKEPTVVPALQAFEVLSGPAPGPCAARFSPGYHMAGFQPGVASLSQASTLSVTSNRLRSKEYSGTSEILRTLCRFEFGASFEF